ncbi:hypothetical protein TCAP_06242 [Tolypocladium capitatum]|uniref:Uncharacterized protein n=1 Tax=Tolypocladium capitatum TaxID=45235 RepID=A0A2K3Q8C5_9HYPO|nr:hypothetical protein TCAP_06242 [Tolypocladium capitatum]
MPTRRTSNVPHRALLSSDPALPALSCSRPAIAVNHRRRLLSGSQRLPAFLATSPFPLQPHRHHRVASHRARIFLGEVYRAAAHNKLARDRTTDNHRELYCPSRLASCLSSRRAASILKSSQFISLCANKASCATRQPENYNRLRASSCFSATDPDTASSHLPLTRNRRQGLRVSIKFLPPLFSSRRDLLPNLHLFSSSQLRARLHSLPDFMSRRAA